MATSRAPHNHTRRICFWCITQTLGFPLEHLAWEKLPVLSSVTHLLGL